MIPPLPPFLQFGEHMDLKPGDFATLEMLHEFSVQRALKQFDEAHRIAPYDIKPHWLIQFGSFMGVVATPFANDREKEVVSRVLGEAMKIANARAYSFFMEAWIANVRPGHDWDKTPPSQHPDREDALIITTYDRKRSLTTRYAVKRAGTPRAKLLARDDWGDSGLVGRFSNLLAPL